MAREEWFMVIIVGIGVIFAVICTIGLIAGRKKIKNNEFSKDEFSKFEYDNMRAKVVDIKCNTHYEGIRMPKLIKDFTVFFEIENGKVLPISVPEEYYEAFEVGQEGELTLVNESFVSFESYEGGKC